MKKFIWLALSWLIISVTPSMIVAADYVRLSAEEFQTVEIPSWMYGYVAVTFEWGDDQYVALHDFQNPKTPVVCLMSSSADSASFRQVAQDVALHWHIGATWKSCSEELIGVERCQEFTWINHLRPWTQQGVEGVRSEIRGVCTQGLYCVQFPIVDIEIQFPGNLPEWAKIHPPFQLYNN